ncbi:TPA: glycosyltransferase [Streptococcus suis]|nr:glycosyltransferase [Streptococcus suis]
MSNNPLVSVICTVYNKAPWLHQTINSFLSQETSFPIEIILIDDASTDDSKCIITDYAERFPDKIKAIYNHENLGIAKTWVKACNEAVGQYIARCDGDDFWIDPLKLEKQVRLLSDNPQSKWCNSDFDIYNEHGELVSKNGFETGTIPLADTFEKMLATRGFTMASTWLVERQLMLTVNGMLDLETSDDTFNLQLDLFQHTELSYLPEATVGYVINQGSDSRPKDFSKIEYRFNRLLETQKDYVVKYPTSDYRKMLDILLDRNNRYELELTKKEGGLGQIGLEKTTIYFADENNQFRQDKIFQIPFSKKESIEIQLPENCGRIRVDLSENPSFFSSVKLISSKYQTEIIPSFSNGISIGHSFIFPNTDPQIIYDIPEFFGKKLILEYEMYEIDDIYSEDFGMKVLGREVLDLKQKQARSESLEIENIQLKNLIENQQKDLISITNQYNSVISSRRWTIPTKIINFFRRNK